MNYKMANAGSLNNARLNELANILIKKFSMKVTKEFFLTFITDKKQYYGCISINKNLEQETTGYREIRITSNSLDMGLKQIIITLLHELSHLENLEAGIQDSTNSGYHNNNFKIAAERNGLVCSKESIGVATRDLNFTMPALWTDKFHFVKSRYSLETEKPKTTAKGKPRGGSKPKTTNGEFIYMCSICGIPIKSKRSATLECTFHNEKMFLIGGEK